MKKIFCLFIIVMTGLLLTSAGETAAESSSPRIILFTYYRQMGWGDRVQVGSVDENGGIRLIIGYDSNLKWPYKPEEQLEYLKQTDKFTAVDTLKSDALFSIKSLVYDVEDRGSKSVPAALDAGTEKSYAVRYSDDGTPVFILLGVSGDNFFENTDPNAQALYLLLRKMFPEVTAYAFGFQGMGPQGFVPVPFSDFTGLDTNILLNAKVKSFLSDCEEGNIPREMTEEETSKLMTLIRSGIVIGKADCVLSTGGFTIYAFYDQADNYIGSVYFEDGLLVMNDGRYYVKNR